MYANDGELSVSLHRCVYVAGGMGLVFQAQCGNLIEGTSSKHRTELMR